MLIMSIFSAEPTIENISQKTEEVSPETKTSVTMVITEINHIPVILET